MTPNTLMAVQENTPTQRDDSRGRKHLLWKECRTFGLPAGVLVGVHFVLTMLGFAFAETRDEFAEFSWAILVFAWTGLSMLWATAAGAIVTAADREDGTDTWMRSLPVSPIRVYQPVELRTSTQPAATSRLLAS